MSRKRPASDKAVLCFRCFERNHSSTDCNSYGPISCSACFRLNVLSKSCNCNDFTQPPPPQVLRLVGKPNAPRWFVDLNIHNRIFAALINTSIERGRVNVAFAIWLRLVTGRNTDSNLDTVTIQIQRNDQVLQITCDVMDNQKEYIEIGTDLMKFLKYTFTMEGCTIESNHSYVAPSPYEINYVYNIPKQGEDLRNYLNKKRFFLKGARTTKHHYGVPQSPAKRVIKVSQSPSRSSSTDSDNDY